MKLKGVLFDFDGVVLDSMKQHVKAWQYAFGKYGLSLTAMDIYLREGMGVKSVVKNVCAKYKLPIEVALTIMKTKSEYYKNHFEVHFYNGFFELLDYLKSQGISMVIVTGGDRNRIIPFALKYLNGYFSGFVCSDDVKETKPSPEPYLKGLEILGLASEYCIVIENAPLGIKAAKAAGIRTLAVETTLNKTYLKDADFIVKSLLQAQSKITNLLRIN